MSRVHENLTFQGPHNRPAKCEHNYVGGAEYGCDGCKKAESKEALEQFYDYLDSFYNPVTGIYPMPMATRENIILATGIWLGRLPTTHLKRFEGDTVDREKVRDILEELG